MDDRTIHLASSASNAIIKSAAFDGKRVLQRMLEYLVNSAISGSSITEETIANQVFGRGDTFERAGDSFVRRNMGRLRSRLVEYYRTEGKNDAIRISLAAGYAPEFMLTELGSGNDSNSELVAPTESCAPKPRSSTSLPPLPPNNQMRTREIEELRAILLAEAKPVNATAVTGISGMGGIGKTVLVNALCRDELVQRTFPDGIAWLSLGRERSEGTTAYMRRVLGAVGDPAFNDGHDASCEFRYASVARNSCRSLGGI
jgi:NB-ARC domain